MFKKNDFVTHPKMPDWGIGIVTKDQSGDDVSVFFENTKATKSIKQSFANLEPHDSPGQSRLFLENVLITDKHKGTMDRQPFPKKVEQFIEMFKGGFRGPVLEKNERQYKQQAREKFVSLLNQEDFKELIDSEQWEELGNRIKKCHSLNLLSAFEIINFSDVMKAPQTQQDIGCGLYDFLYGAAPIHERFKSYVAILEAYGCDKWPIITLPLFLCFPTEYMFVKPMVTQEAAANRGFDIQYESQLNWNTYNKVLLFSQDLFERLSAYGNPDLHPKDLIDVQTFMWCTFTKGWDAAEIAKAEAEIKASV